jgi:hypothetical protein
LIKRVSKEVQLCAAGSLAELESCPCIAIP